MDANAIGAKPGAKRLLVVLATQLEKGEPFCSIIQMPNPKWLLHVMPPNWWSPNVYADVGDYEYNCDCIVSHLAYKSDLSC